MCWNASESLAGFGLEQRDGAFFEALNERVLLRICFEGLEER